MVKIAAAGATAAVMLVAAAFGFPGPGSGSDAEAAPNVRGACVQAGIGTLKELGLLRDAAQRKIDYSTLADPVNGPIFADLPEGSFLSLGQVVKLHVTSPELFAWCRPLLAD
jgi:hypothetical protein